VRDRRIVWIASTTLYDGGERVIERWIAETTPDRDRVLVPERAAHRGDRIARANARRVAERNGHESDARRVDLEQRHVVVAVPADDLGLHAVAVLERDEDLLRLARWARLDDVRDHVRARQDVAAARDDEAGALACCSAACRRSRTR
jgi:hypothetical protein